MQGNAYKIFDYGYFYDCLLRFFLLKFCDYKSQCISAFSPKVRQKEGRVGSKF